MTCTACNTAEGAKFTGVCKPCYGKAYRSANKDKIKAVLREYHKQYYQKNKEKILEKNRAWFKKNPEKRSEMYKKWCIKNPEKYKARARKLYEQNIDYYRQYNKSYGRKKKTRQATPKWVDRKELREIYLNRPEGFHVDHVIPITGKGVCGLHVPWNLQYLPATENLKKGNKY